MRRTKIVCTMGPNTNSRDLMKKLIETGMDVARFNFSHGDHDEQKMRMDMLKELRKELKTPVAILLDTKGPEIRTGVLKDGKKVNLVTGQTFTLTTVQETGDEDHCSVSYTGLTDDIKEGDTILIDDGLIGLRVEKVNAPEIVCTVVNSGEHYYQGGLIGGESKAYIELLEQCSLMTETDLKRNITARWHDESYLNKYLLDKQIKILSTEYGRPQEWTVPPTPKIIFRDKNTILGASYICSLKKRNRLKLISKAIRNILNKLLKR